MKYLSDLRREVEFVLIDWLRCVDDAQTLSAVLDLSERLAAQSFAPCYRPSDQIEPELVEDGVRVLPQVREAVLSYAESGLFGAGFAQAHGGMDLSNATCAGSFLLVAAANLAASAYPMLTVANARLLTTFASGAQIDAFARPQIEGRWLGTMCLSEPQAGSNLGDITTRAKPDVDDALGARYRVFGNKMWISGGEHDICENIVHLVLAKVVSPDGCVVPGTAGTTLLIVPRYLHDGSANDVAVAGLNHKLGYRGIPNCVLNFGEGLRHPEGEAGALGWRVGAEGDGLRQMFRMMNEARIGVSLGAAAVGYRAFRQALVYASERVQGRPAGAARDDVTRVPIVAHPDVQRMLMRQKVFAEGALALSLLCASLVDSEAEDGDLLALLTPVAKSWTSAWSLVVNDLAIQVHGGYGYTGDFDVEQLWRDNRLNMIHEGTNGIQAIDLLERKILRSDGGGLAALRVRVQRTAATAAEHSDHEPLAATLVRQWAGIEHAIKMLRGMPPVDALHHASPFLDAFGHVVVAWLWLDQALTCRHRAGDFSAGKILACRAFFEIELPAVSAWLTPIVAPDRSSGEIAASQF